VKVKGKEKTSERVSRKDKEKEKEKEYRAAPVKGFNLSFSKLTLGR